MNSTRLYRQIVLMILMGIVFASGQTYAQKNLFQQRELKAPDQIKQQLAALRTRIQSKNLSFQVGYTRALEVGLQNLTSIVSPIDMAANALAHKSNAVQILRFDLDARTEAVRLNPALRVKIPELNLACNTSFNAWDWRKRGKVTSVKLQKCGNCWAYASCAALESSWLIRNNQTIDASEQYVVSNSNAGVCGNGYCSKALAFLVSTGTCTEAQAPDMGVNGTPNPNMVTPYDGIAWDFVNLDNAGSPTVEQIKQALCEHGPVATWIDAGGTFGAYTGGVYNDTDDKEPGHKAAGHFVLIIGWDDAKQAWLIKNSWGTTWGDECGYGSERGYMWIGYGIHSVGAWAMWIKAKSNLYKLPAEYYKMFPKKIALPRPVGPR